ncbi:MAG TPA: NAD(P)/FAD-dependent oxidoreductase [Bacteroidales bacterium]|nr:NAD(P)/FAD-dependent oxidoreductase [Bacteroidales bacterium]HPF02517.1 NAD(P)/FAD-dependent oxidoreductase [Bacteroidales bacterium]HPJ58374.1 NAD(P)/FAD-dependent oxidoreductase [Bacteroidales bacterium]HPR10820.1 NAD(P)/FAD-dependent oxidoreductase [Bacteroidales bacterium]HRW84219.1 NAD(P)/FAD-dependent oxidoreductase [Bacteroidales bacterium]
MKFDIVIIGSGLGGLLCANILGREGYSVCLIEKNSRLGGSLQSFRRKGCVFNTGLNYIESFDSGQILNQYFRYFGISENVSFRRLDEDGFDIISFPDGKYPLAIGHNNYIEQLRKFFPGEKQSLERYLKDIQGICASISLYNLSDKPFSIMGCESLGVGAAAYLKSVIKNPRLCNVVAGNNLMYSGDASKTPLMIHALISNSFVESAWRIVDGSNRMISILANNITAAGGTIIKKTRAVKLTTGNNRVKTVILENGEEIEAEFFISNTHPDQLLSMTDYFKPSGAFAQRMSSLTDTIGMFTLYIVFKKDSFPCLNYNFYHYNQDNVWIAGEYDVSKWPQGYLFMPTATSRSGDYAESASVITYMSYDEVSEWKSTITGRRGDRYLDFKRNKGEILLNDLERHFPGIRSCVDTFYTSTPLTWRDYTGTRSGSAFGLMKDFNKPMESIVLPRTKIPNLFLTGQNINFHGILGVTISAVLTAGEITDINKLIRKIKNS